MLTADEVCPTEVDEPRRSVRRDHDVVGVHVAMEDPVIVQVRVARNERANDVGTVKNVRGFEAKQVEEGLSTEPLDPDIRVVPVEVLPDQERYCATSRRPGIPEDGGLPAQVVADILARPALDPLDGDDSLAPRTAFQEVSITGLPCDFHDDEFPEPITLRQPRPSRPSLGAGWNQDRLDTQRSDERIDVGEKHLRVDLHLCAVFEDRIDDPARATESAQEEMHRARCAVIRSSLFDPRSRSRRRFPRACRGPPERTRGRTAPRHSGSVLAALRSCRILPPQRFSPACQPTGSMPSARRRARAASIRPASSKLSGEMVIDSASRQAMAVRQLQMVPGAPAGP